MPVTGPKPFVDRWGWSMLGVTVLAPALPPFVVYEPPWEVAAGLGYAACAAAVITLRTAPWPRLAMTPYRYRLHRVAGNAMLALVAGHVAVMVAGDPFVLDYLGWQMPLHVLAGVLAAVALLVTIVGREPCLRRAAIATRPPSLHSWAGIAVGVLATVHVLTSLAKVSTPWRGLPFVLVFLLLVLPAMAARLTGRPWSCWRLHPADEPWAAVPGATGRLLLLLLALLTLLIALPLTVGRLRG
ncbi:MAG: hypothetical protein WAS21_12765 [Geminicoccaceae bacterium]